MVEGLATAIDPKINMWDVAAPFVRGWIRDELGPEAAIADRLREDAATLLRLPDLVRRIEQRYPPKGGAPDQPPLPPVPLLWENKPRFNQWVGYLLAAAAGGLAVWAAMATSLLTILTG
jgi:ubiquinone biosynthesis protein